VEFNAIEFCQPLLGRAPEIFYAVNVDILFSGKLVAAVIKPEMLVISDINQAVIFPLFIRINNKCGHSFFWQTRCRRD
jgi:hypothetical protein